MMPKSLAALIGAPALTLALVAGEALAAPAVTEAATDPCRVKNLTRGTHGSSLIRMVQRTRDGDRLVLRGTCAGPVVIGTDIVITGKGTWPTISGHRATRGVRVKPGATVVLKRLRIRRGIAQRHGGGINNGGQLTLRKVVMRFNRYAIYNSGAARLTVIGSIIRDNRFAIYNRGDLTVIGSTVGGDWGWIKNVGQATITNSKILGNSKDLGIDNYGQATLTVIGSIIRDNRVGIYNAGTATLTDTTVTGNSARGITNYGTATLTDTTVTGNTTNASGGGIYVEGLVTLVRTTVSGNTAGDYGGGIYVRAGSGYRYRYEGEVILIDSEVTGNSAGIEGGGIAAVQVGGPPAPKVTLQGNSSVHDNRPDNCVGTAAC